ncbi:MAG: N-6 DNA methylase, partial [Chloroflexi bacterium]|nr:N-6 DNA methylase [Chloroflexota bacterium]
MEDLDDEERIDMVRSFDALDKSGWLAPLLRESHVTPQAYVTHAPPEHRRHFGQYFTPQRIAEWMAAYVLQPDTRTVLDPAAGTGVLLEALLQQPGWKPEIALTALDIDPAILQVLAHNLDSAAPSKLMLRQGDFLLDPDASLYDAIICNPPYIRHRHLRNRQALLGMFERRLDLKLSAFSNSYVLFILGIATRLAAHGRAAIITPFEYLNANFGVPIRSFLLRQNLVDGLALFEHTRLVFDDANTTACVLLLRAGRAADDPIAFVHVADETELAPIDDLPEQTITCYRVAELDAEAKWLPLFPSTPTAPVWLPDRRMVALGELADVRRGIATGANDFFTLTETERTSYGIALTQTRLCVTKAAHAPDLRFTDADLERLRAADKKIYLLDTRDELTSAIRAYLDRGEQLGIHRRFLPAHRSVWFAPESRPVAPLWVNAFSRRSFRFVLNDAGIANLTTFHGIYPFVTERDPLLLLAAFLNSGIAATVIARQHRIYGSGLHKFEPLDVAALHAPDPASVPDSLSAAIVQAYLRRCEIERTDRDEAARLKDEIDQLWREYLRGA